ncbi:MAG: SDR family oxidoreductase [Tannerellaceae bacterium]|jgi:3-oxoacyl-[acyl-carrier protein] reductase|nr:SDR family oxidoreductase [Tannerellaceae bacterium]
MKKCACITGGTKGIGRAVAEAMAADGYNLLLTYAADSNAAKRAGMELWQRFGLEVHVVQADITSPEAPDKLRTYIREKKLLLDALVFNAGLTARASLNEIQREEWERVFFANVHFPVFCLQALLTHLRPGACVVFTGSRMADAPHSLSLAYGVSKAAVHALVRNLVKFLQPYGIRVNGVAPGFVDTQWQQDKPPEIRQSIESKIAAGRFCRPQEVADVYRMLILNDYFNGEVITIDGAYSYK